MTDRQQGNFDWLDDEPTPKDVANRLQALREDPQLLGEYLKQVRFDHHLALCLGDALSSGAATSSSKSGSLESEGPADSGQVRIWARIIAQAWADDGYKARLLADPATVLREEGLQVPAGRVVRIVENTDAQAYLVLPATPPESKGDAVSEMEHRLAAGFGWLLW